MKRTLAMLLAAMLAVSTATVAFADQTTWGESGEIEGEGDVTNPIIAYQLPTDLDFSLDAFSMGDETGSQIYSPGYPIINKSQVAIKVDVKADLTLATGVTAKTSIEEVKVNDTTYDAKDLYMEMVAQEITAATLPSPQDSGVTATVITYKQTGDTLGAQTKAKAVLAAASDAKPLLMTFALDKATYDTTQSPALIQSVPADGSGAGQLRFAGTINPNSDWKPGDVTVKAVFDVRGLTPSNYTTLMPADLEADWKAANVASVGSSGGGSSVVTGAPKITTAGPLTPVSGQNLTFEVDLGADDKAATTVASITYNGTTLPKSFNGWSISGTTITIKAAQLANIAGNTLTVTFDDVNDTVATIAVSAL